jgi:prepilin-type N-terminal cleavage/methylation domain-containing protein
MSVLSRPARRQAGVTLVEMLVAVVLVSLVAAIAIPQASSVSPAVVNAAGAEVAHAIRYAQREAVRTGKYYVAEIDPAKQTVRVYRLVTSGTATVEDTDNPVMHPVDKQPYRITLAGNAAMRAVVASSVFTYAADTTSDVTFGPDGTPVDVNFVKGKVAAGALSADGAVLLRSGAASRTVTVDKITGRVRF